MKKILIFTASALFVVSSLVAEGNEYRTAEIYDSLRKQVLSLKPEQLGEYGNGPVLCVIMETGYPKAVATVVAVADGTASLYFSNGGGIIGAGEHAEGRAAAMSVIDYAKKFLVHTKPTKSFSLPQKGDTRFYFVTPKGVKTVKAKEETFGNNRHKLSPLFHKVHELIYTIQIIERRKKAEQGG